MYPTTNIRTRARQIADAAAAAGVTLEDLIQTSVDADRAERILREIAAAGAAKKYRAFGELAKADPKAAAKLFGDADAGSRGHMLRELEQDDLAAWARALPPNAQQLVVDHHPNPCWLRAQVAPTDKVPRYYRVFATGGEHGVGNVTAYYTLAERDLTDAQVSRLVSVGLGDLVRAPTHNVFPTPDPHRLVGTIEGELTWSSDAVAAVRAIAPDFDAAVESGRVRAEPLSVEACRDLYRWRLEHASKAVVHS